MLLLKLIHVVVYTDPFIHQMATILAACFVEALPRHVQASKSNISFPHADVVLISIVGHITPRQLAIILFVWYKRKKIKSHMTDTVWFAVCFLCRFYPNKLGQNISQVKLRRRHGNPAVTDEFPSQMPMTQFRCFLWSAPEQTVEQTIRTPVIWDAIAFIMTSL